jgi:hypothetical protein
VGVLCSGEEEEEEKVTGVQKITLLMKFLSYKMLIIV